MRAVVCTSVGVSTTLSFGILVPGYAEDSNAASDNGLVDETAAVAAISTKCEHEIERAVTCSCARKADVRCRPWPLVRSLLQASGRVSWSS